MNHALGPSPARKLGRQYYQGMKTADRMTTGACPVDYSVERRSSGAGSTFTGSDLAGSDLAGSDLAGSDLAGSILALSTRGVSTRAVTSARDAATAPVSST